MLQDNLAQVENKIQNVCKANKIPREDVTLIAVSKTKPIEMLQEIYDAGCREFGENKVQELVDKYDAMPKDIHWHMIGHLQRNKVKYIIGKVALIHSVDSLRLAETIEKESAKKNVVTDILIEVNMGREESKFGVLPEDIFELLQEISKMNHIRVKGLMTVAPFVDNPEKTVRFLRKCTNYLLTLRAKTLIILL